jgi:hypothetical protein
VGGLFLIAGGESGQRGETCATLERHSQSEKHIGVLDSNLRDFF